MSNWASAGAGQDGSAPLADRSLCFTTPGQSLRLVYCPAVGEWFFGTCAPSLSATQDMHVLGILTPTVNA